MSQPFNAFGDTDAQTLMMSQTAGLNAGELPITLRPLAPLDGQSGELVICELGDTAGASRPRRFRPHEGIEAGSRRISNLWRSRTPAPIHARRPQRDRLRSLVCVALITASAPRRDDRRRRDPRRARRAAQAYARDL